MKKRDLSLKVCLALMALTCFAFQGKAQNELTRNLLRSADFHEHRFDEHKVQFLRPESKKFLVRYNPITYMAGGMLYAYQKVISAQLSTHCPYEHSCSQFSKMAIKEYGILKGVALSADRLTRCTQFTVSDITPLNFNEDHKIKDPLEDYSLKK